MTDLLIVTDAAPAQSSDRIVLMRAGVAYTMTIAELAATFQAAINLNAGAFLGRASGTSGPPQAMVFGPGIATAGTTAMANGVDHLGLNLLTIMDVQAELIVNSAGRPSRLPFSAMRGFFPFSPGNGVTIDANGVISVNAAPPSDALLDQNGLALLDENGSPLLG